MTFFQHDPQPDQESRRVFLQPVEDDADWEENLDSADLAEDLRDSFPAAAEDALERQERQSRIRLLAGMSDFLLIVLGVVAVIALSALILALVLWLRRDIVERLPVLENLTGAGLRPGLAGGVHGIL